MLEIFEKGIQKGAYMIVASWENDGDSCATNVKHFNNIQDALFYKAMMDAQSPLQNHYYESVKGLFTESEFADAVDAVNDLLESEDFDNSDLKAKTKKRWENSSNDVKFDVLCNFHDTTGSSEYYFMRVVDKCDIFEVSEDIKIPATRYK